MKLSEVTSKILNNYMKNEYEHYSYPNLVTWTTLAVDLTEHIFSLPNTEDPCWEWGGDPKKRKISVIHNSVEQGKTTFSFQIKRFAFYLYNLECQRHVINEVYHTMLTKPKKFLQNTCNNSDCFNPEHLKESFTPFDVNKAYEHVRGEQHARSKLTEEQVRYMYQHYIQDHVTVKEVAREFNVSVATVYGILKGRTWRHLNLKPTISRNYARNKTSTQVLRGE